MNTILNLHGITGDRIRCTKMWDGGGVIKLFVLDVGRGIVYNGIIVGVTYEKGA